MRTTLATLAIMAALNGQGIAGDLWFQVMELRNEIEDQQLLEDGERLIEQMERQEVQSQLDEIQQQQREILDRLELADE